MKSDVVEHHYEICNYNDMYREGYTKPYLLVVTLWVKSHLWQDCILSVFIYDAYSHLELL